MLDGQRLPVGQLDWDGSTVDSGYRDVGVRTFERMTIFLPTKVFETILTAKVIEGQLGLYTFTLAAEQLAAIKAVFSFPPEPIASPELTTPVKKPAPISRKQN